MSAAGQITQHVAATVRYRRHKLGWSQAKLAVASGLKRAAVVNLETGSRESITVEEVYALAEAMDVAPSYLLPAAPGERMSFEQALAEVAERYAEAIRERGPSQ